MTTIPVQVSGYKYARYLGMYELMKNTRPCHYDDEWHSFFWREVELNGYHWRTRGAEWHTVESSWHLQTYDFIWVHEERSLKPEHLFNISAIKTAH